MKTSKPACRGLFYCAKNLKMSSTFHVTRSLVNSDVIGNEFNQQRSTYNLANTNPNALQYRKLSTTFLWANMSYKGNQMLEKA